MKPITTLICLAAALALAAGCGAQSPVGAPATATTAPPAPMPSAQPSPVTPTSTPVAAKTPLVVFGAGSLILPFGELEKAFENRYPQIDVQAEYHGSIQVMRHVTDLHESIDVVATADQSLIPMLMYATKDPDTDRPYADWYIRFASNRLALAYTPQSRYAGEINADNWPAVLARPGLKVGIADPRFDASGYRALMAYALAQDSTHRPTLFADMFKGQFITPITIFQDDELTTITVPEVLETRPGATVVLRGASIQLIALLESGDLDYAFEYESVIRQHELKLLHLPDAVNLGTEGYEATYGRVQVNLDFRRFATIKPQFRGERIGYGITIPSNAPHPAEAAQFIAFLLGPEGRALMQAQYHPLFDPAVADGYDKLPAGLRSVCVPASATSAASTP
jgi:molybdate/tungstate transport system substrate-binding protein